MEYIPSLKMVSYRCSFCDYFSLSKDDMHNHMTVHYAERKYECSICDKRFFNEKTLELHLHSHATGMKFETYPSTSGQQVFSSEIGSSATTSQMSDVPQVKVRVKTFPENPAVLKEPCLQPQLSDSEIQFQLQKDEFTMIAESQAYASQEEEIFSEKKPIQFKMWTKEHCAKPSLDATATKSPFVVRVVDKEPESQRILEPNTEGQNDQPIRIFVGSNIRLENLEDLNNLSSLGEEFPTDGLPQVNFGQDQAYNYNYEEQNQENHQPLQEIKDAELSSLQEVIEEGDLVSIQDEIGAENLQSLEETMTNGSFQVQEKAMSSKGMKSFQGDTACSGSFLVDDVTDGKKVQLNSEPVNFCASQEFYGETVDSKCIETPEKSQNENVLNHQVPLKEFSSGICIQGEDHSRFTNKKVRSSLNDEAENDPDDPPPLPEAENNPDNPLPMPLEDEGSMNASEKSSPDKNIEEDNQVLNPLPEKSISELANKAGSTTSLKKDNAMVVCPEKKPEVKEVDCDEAALKMQIMDSSEKPYKCELCGMGFRFSFYCNAHMKTAHSQIESSTSTECCKFYKKLENMHPIEEQDPSKIFQCTECMEQLCSAYELKKHMNKHRKIGNHECGLCFLKFKHCLRYYCHLKTHLVHKCYICDKLFKDSTGLNMHMQSHLKKKLFECKTCQRIIYCHPKEFYRHELMHQFVMWCPYCCKNISSKEFHKHKLKCARLYSEYATEKENLSNVMSGIEVGGTRGKKDLTEVRTKVVELLINDLLQDMSEEDAKEHPFRIEMDDWVNDTSECITNEKFRNCISKCSTRSELLKELSAYSQSDFIKDAVSDLHFKERIAVQRLLQITDMNERIESVSSHSLKRKRK